MDLYVAGHRSKRRHPGRALLEVLIVLAVLVGAIFAGKHFLSSDTTIGQTPPAQTTTVTARTQNKKHFTEQFFSFDLPSDWESMPPPNQPHRILSWRNTAQNKGVQQLNIYVDGAPQLAVNRVLPIQANGSRLALLGQVSDNCATFTEGAKSASGGSLQGKWRRVNFLCDTANIMRDVVGTSSPGGINTVAISSASSGRHSFFFTYTDNGATPDYDVFTNFITSFQLK
jgi:hypothetical protein